jgi:hypothetical protein
VIAVKIHEYKVKPSVVHTSWRWLGWIEEVWLQLLDLSSSGGWVVVVTHWLCFTVGTHWIGQWVGPRTNLNAKARKKSFASARYRTSHPVHSHFTNWATLDLLIRK